MAGKEDCQIFVGGLSWCTTERMLDGAFRRFGKILDTQVITKRHTGRKRGFGFVTFSDPRSVISAITFMHDQVLDGQIISVHKAYPKHDARCDTGYGPPRYGNCFSWDRDRPDGAGVRRRPGRFFSEFTVRGDFFEWQGGRFSGDRYDANDGYYQHMGGRGRVGADRDGNGSGVPDRHGYGGDHQRGRSCDRGGALRGHGRSASMGPGRRHRSASRPRGGGGRRGREVVTMTVKVSRAIM